MNPTVASSCAHPYDLHSFVCPLIPCGRGPQLNRINPWSQARDRTLTHLQDILGPTLLPANTDTFGLLSTEVASITLMVAFIILEMQGILRRNSFMEIGIHEIPGKTVPNRHLHQNLRTRPKPLHSGGSAILYSAICMHRSASVSRGVTSRMAGALAFSEDVLREFLPLHVCSGVSLLVLSECLNRSGRAWNLSCC